MYIYIIYIYTLYIYRERERTCKAARVMMLLGEEKDELCPDIISVNSVCDQIAFVSPPDLYWRSSDSDDNTHKAGGANATICSANER